MLAKIVNIQTKTMPPLIIGDNTITPVAQVVRLAWPGATGGLFWARPVAVKVQYQAAPERTLPITDQTRQLQIGLFLVAGVFAILAWHNRKSA